MSRSRGSVVYDVNHRVITNRHLGKEGGVRRKDEETGVWALRRV